MLDSRIRPLIDPALDTLGRIVANQNISANQVTVAGFGFGLITLPLIAAECYFAAFVMLMLNRVMDGVDGAVARINGVTNLGGYLDIVLDFISYSAVVFGFCLAQPEHAVYGAFLIFSFIGTGTSFLTFAIMAEKLNLSSEAQGKKSMYYLGGIAEGFETILVLALMCLLPNYFWLLALVFGTVCWASTLGRIAQAVQTLR